jgi:capsid protein
VPFETLDIERGMMTTLPYGIRAKQLAAEQPSTTLDMFTRITLREIARCLNMSFNVAAGDSSGYNYSSGRLDHLIYHRQLRVERAQCETVVLDRIFDAWLNEAVMIPGLLPDGFQIVDVPHRWFWDAIESIDPQKDGASDSLDLANNTTTLEELCAGRGEDWEEVLEQRGREIARARELGVPVEQAPALTQQDDAANQDSRQPAGAST